MIQFRIFALTALALVSILPMAKPAPPTLTTQFFSQPVALVQWSNTVTVNIPGVCPLNLPFTLTLEGLNFTENLSGRDTGSTVIQFRGLPESPSSFLIKASDITGLWLTEFFCSEQFPPSTPGGPSPATIQDLLSKLQTTMLATSGTWRVPSSGNYVVIDTTPLPSPTATFPFPAVANETWTVSTIS